MNSVIIKNCNYEYLLKRMLYIAQIAGKDYVPVVLGYKQNVFKNAFKKCTSNL